MNKFSIRSIEDAIAAVRSGGDGAVFRGAAPISEIRQAEAGEMKVGTTKIFKMSTEIRDRHNTMVVLAGGDIDQYNLNPVILWMHESHRGMFDAAAYDPDNVIGKGRAYYEGDGLYNAIDFEPKRINARANVIEEKIVFGSIRAGSIGFIPLEGHWGIEADGEDTGTYYITRWTLLEYSIVVIPSNYLALVQEGVNSDEARSEEMKQKMAADKKAAEVAAAQKVLEDAEVGDGEGDDDGDDDQKGLTGATAVALARHINKS